jgi:hypothetical protein
VTVTVTQEVSRTPSALSLSLALRSAEKQIEEEVGLLFKRMKALHLFSQEDLEVLALSFESLDLTNEGGRISTSVDLCSLMFDTIMPHLQNATGPKKELSSFVQEIKKMLSLTIPKGKTIEGFIDEYLGYEDEEIEVKEKEKIKEDVDQEMTLEAFRLANEKNAEFKEMFIMHKDRLKKYNEEHKAQAKELQLEVSHASDSIARIGSSLMTAADDMQRVATNLCREEATFEQLLAQAERIEEEA